jgi:hypothetical protein
VLRFRVGALRRLLRRPSWYLAASVATVAATAGLTFQFLSAAQTGAARFGRPVTVYVAAEDLAAGSTIRASDIRRMAVPTAAVPPSALRRSPRGETLAQDVAAGQILVAAAVAGTRRSPLAASLPPETVGVAIPRTMGLPPVRRGDRVDLWAPESSAPLEVAAPVVALNDATVIVAVRSQTAGEVAAAILAGPVLLAVRGTG